MKRGWLSRLLGPRRKASELIRDHLSGAGNGFELDDLVSCGKPEWEDVAQRLMDINLRHNVPGEPPLGVYSDRARQDLLTLAEELEAEGL
jgi:hypothetical protein